MGITHIRLPKNFVLDERLERYASAIEQNAPALAGRWAEACFPWVGAGGGESAPVGDADAAQRPGADGTDAPTRRFREVRLDLGCGKGAFIAACARREPDVLYIGMDAEPVCVAYAAQRMVEEELSNAVIVPLGADALPRIFAPGELSAIILNFPTPHPKRHNARHRLVTVDHLLSYRPLLAQDGTITLRTDSQPLRDYAILQFEAAGMRTRWITDNCREEHPEFPQTEYEQRLTEQGAAVYGICAEAGPEPSPEHVLAGRDAEQSLMCYLPEDLFALDYVPLGMEAAVTNFRNRQRKGKSRIPGTKA